MVFVLSITNLSQKKKKKVISLKFQIIINGLSIILNHIPILLFLANLIMKFSLALKVKLLKTLPFLVLIMDGESKFQVMISL